MNVIGWLLRKRPITIRKHSNDDGGIRRPDSRCDAPVFVGNLRLWPSYSWFASRGSLAVGNSSRIAIWVAVYCRLAPLTGETTRDTGDAQRGLCLIIETRRDTGDVGGARRMARNPATTGRSVTAEVTATTPHSDSSGPTATATYGKVVTCRQVAARN